MHPLKPFCLVAVVAMSSCVSTGDDEDSTASSSDTVIDVDASLMMAGEYLSVSTVDCTLSDGSESQCYEFVSKHTPVEHTMGPFCPESIYDGADKGGLWTNDGEAYDLDGPFIENLATFYEDSEWQMFDADTGDVYRFETEDQCAQGADPDVEDEYQNMCAQCQPEWVEAEVTYLIPITPVKQAEPVELSDGPTLEEPGVEYGPQLRGLAFNGVRFDHPADVEVILAAHQVAPLDDAGGHVNNNLGYHYHGDTGFMTRVEQADGHSAMIGYALDGHAFYAELDADGNEATDLDECRGHDDDTRGYHYHVMSIGNNEIIDCFYGAWADDGDDDEEEQGGGPPER